jgi:hypothetical protein
MGKGDARISAVIVGNGVYVASGTFRVGASFGRGVTVGLGEATALSEGASCGISGAGGTSLHAETITNIDAKRLKKTIIFFFIIRHFMIP